MKDKKIFCRDFARERYGQAWQLSAAEAVRVTILVKLVSSGSRVLDIGCYDGTIAACFKKNNNRIFGIDISQEALKIAHSKGIPSSVADINQSLPFKDNSFDVVCAAEVIEHALDISGFIKEIKRVLKKDGKLILSTPNLASLGRRLCLLFGGNPLIEIEFEGGSAGHIRYFVKDTLKKLLNKYGFRIEEFCSDVVNFDNSGSHFCRLLARIAPGFGKSLIVKTTNNK